MDFLLIIMPYDNCKSLYKCKACPVTVADKNEGALPITKDKGDIWFCTSCFYCEDICPDYSPRQYAIDRRRTEDQQSSRMLEPIDKLKKQGQLFDINKSINDIRIDNELPILPPPNIDEVAFLIDEIMGLETSKKPLTRDIADGNQSKKIALFLGCLIPYRVPDYELSARRLLTKLSVEFKDLPFSCCGSIMTESQSEELWLTIAAYNLALAEKYGVQKIVSLCGGCSGNLRKANLILLKNPEKMKNTNHHLAKISLTFSGKVEIKHLSEFLREEELQSKYKKLVSKQNSINLSKLTVATQVPCQVIRPEKYSPSASIGASLLIDLLKHTSINVVHYPFETFCCGSTMLQYDERIAHDIAKKRINSLIKHKVDAITMGCGNCSMNYTVHQSEYTELKMATLFFTEILDYALGTSYDRIDVLLKNKNEKG